MITVELKRPSYGFLVLPNFGTLVYIVGAFIAFHYRDRCAELHDLFEATFIIAIVICLSPCLTCLLLCITGGVEAVKSLFSRPTVRETGYGAVPDVERGHTGF